MPYIYFTFEDRGSIAKLHVDTECLEDDEQKLNIGEISEEEL
jgi:hypothetical protein